MPELVRWSAVVLLATLVSCTCDKPLAQSDAVLDPTPQTLDFGPSTVGARVSRSIALHNGGTRRVQLLDLLIDGQHRAMFDVAVPSSRFVEVDDTLSLTVTFAPTATGGAAARLVVRSDAHNEELAVPLSGVAFDAVVDAGAPDSGAPDAGALDGGAPDAGAVDAGASDSGAVDAGVFDSGIADAGAPDAGAPDAGCVPETNEVLCVAHASVCGMLTTTDRCGVTRVVNSCGTCGGPGACTSGACVATSCGASLHVSVLSGTNPKGAWGGTRYGVVFESVAGVQFAFVSGGGVLDAASVTTIASVNAGHAFIAWNGQEFGVAYYLYTPHPTGSTLEPWFLRISATGQPVASGPVPLPINPGRVRYELPVVTWNPAQREWATAWAVNEGSTSSSGTAVAFVRLDASGVVVPGSLLELAGDHYAYALLWSGTDYALWSTSSTGHPAFTLINAAGVVTTHQDLAVPWRRDGAMVWTGSEYLIVATVPGSNHETRLVRVDVTGAVVPGSDVRLMDETYWQHAAFTGSELVVVGPRLVGGSDYQIFRQRFTATGTPTTAEEAMTCTGFNEPTSLVWNGFQHALFFNHRGGPDEARVALFR